MKEILKIIIPVLIAIAALLGVMFYKPPAEVEDREVIIKASEQIQTAEAVKVITATPTAEPAEEKTVETLPIELTATEQVTEEEPVAEEPEYEPQLAEEPVEEVQEESQEEPSVGEYLGTWTVTAYCPCEECCGSWAYGATASGTMPQAWHTVAVYDLPFGTEIYIDGLGTFTVEDRGVTEYWVDVFVEDHETALDFGMKSVDVYLVN